MEIDFKGDSLDDWLDDSDPDNSIEDELAGASDRVEVKKLDGDLVFSWSARASNPVVEVMRFDRARGLLIIRPRFRQGVIFENPFTHVEELQLELPGWDPRYHSKVGDRYGLLQVSGLPKGFSATYAFGLGVRRDYRGILAEIDERTPCSVVRFCSPETEGVDGSTFLLNWDRFERYRAAVDLSRSRAGTAAARVIAADRHNAVADLFGLDRTEPKYGVNPTIRAMTQEVATGYVMTPENRAALVDEVVRAAPQVAADTPKRFGKLRSDIEFVSLEILSKQFHDDLQGPHSKDEDHWQSFFSSNPFALQQVFSAPVVVVREQAHVKGTDLSGKGARITDFLCVNAVTRTAVVVEIKTPGSKLMAGKPYRGRGDTEIFPTHRDLAGAVGQVQAQIESIPRDMQDHAEFGRIDKWHVQGALIAGRVSDLTEVQRDSFLRYRESLHSLTVLGYDEVGERLVDLLKLLGNAESLEWPIPPSDGVAPSESRINEARP